MQRLYPMQNTKFGSKTKIARNVRKTFLQTHKSCSMQKTARKSGYFFKNQSNLKMTKNGHNAKAIAHAKYSIWVKK